MSIRTREHAAALGLAALAAWTVFGDEAKYIPVQYGEPLPEIEDGSKVFHRSVTTPSPRSSASIESHPPTRRCSNQRSAKNCASAILTRRLLPRSSSWAARKLSGPSVHATASTCRRSRSPMAVVVMRLPLDSRFRSINLGVCSMSHHWDERVGFYAARTLEPTAESRATRDRIAEMMNVFAANYPHGKLDPADKGQFRYTVKANPTAQIVRVEFNGPVTAIGFTLEETEQFIEALEQARLELRGITP